MMRIVILNHEPSSKKVDSCAVRYAHLVAETMLKTAL